MSASIITHIPRWFGWAFPELKFDPQAQYARARDVIAWGNMRLTPSDVARMAREWTLANACDAIAESGSYVSPNVVTLRHAIGGTSPFDAVFDGAASPVVAIVPRYETIYSNALRNLAARFVTYPEARHVTEIACDDQHAAYQAVVVAVRNHLPRGTDEYGELAEQIIEHAITGAAIDRSWIAQATAPASELIDAAYRDLVIRLLYHLVRATDPLLCADSLASTLEERARIERLTYEATLARASEKSEKPPA